jgi:GTPase SAR1 family protein
MQERQGLARKALSTEDSPKYSLKPEDINFCDLPNKCDTAVEPSRQTNIGERFLHRREVVGDDEGGEEEPAVRGSHTCKFASVIAPSMYGWHAYHRILGM